MEIILGKTAGFCAGVASAVRRTEEILEKSDRKVYCLGELVHNGNLVKKLEERGLQIVEDVEEADKDIIIRAHGLKKEIYEKAKRLNIKVNDFTCPKVLRIHKMAEEYSKKGYHIFLLGKPTHPEVIGIKSFCGENSSIIRTIEDVESALKDVKKDRLLVIEQTTYNIEKFEQIVSKIKSLLDDKIELKIEKTICKATELRQKETAQIAEKTDVMIIIGGKNSSNTTKLYEIAKENCENTIFVQTKQEIDIDDIKKYNKIGIMAGASTPKYIIDEVIDALK